MTTKTQLEVKKASYNDIEDIYNITQEAFKRYIELTGLPTVAALKETKEDIKSDIENKLVLIAIKDSETVGSVRIDIKEDKTAYLSRFGVKVKAQNNGVGKILMDSVDSEMKKLGIKSICLHTVSKATALMRFYYERGYYVESTSTDIGYLRALLRKDY